MRLATNIVFPLICLGLAACVGAPESDADDADAVVDVAPGGHGHATLPAGQGAAGYLYSGTPTTGTISRHGGSVMRNGANVYLIWYGDWSGNSATTILTDLAQSIGGSSWFDINTTYSDSVGSVPNSVTYAGSTTDAYSQGKALTDSGVKTVVSKAISSGSLPADADGVYFVLTSADVAESSGFCSMYCGWHTHATISSTDIKYAFVGNPDRCPSACEAETSSPNDNAGADGMASVLAHELAETVTDPDLNAWYDATGYENADKCAWTWGTTFKADNGADANMRIGSRDYLIQQNWVNSGSGYCAATYGSSPPYGSTVSITSYVTGDYVCAENAGASPLIANRTAVGPWEEFKFADLGSGKVSIKALVNGKYVCAESGGSSPLIADKSSVSSCATFQYIDLGNQWFALEASVNGDYVCAESAGASSLIANRTAIGGWEIFRWDLQ